jgi:hypothetical protein
MAEEKLQHQAPIGLESPIKNRDTNTEMTRAEPFIPILATGLCYPIGGERMSNWMATIRKISPAAPAFNA